MGNTCTFIPEPSSLQKSCAQSEDFTDARSQDHCPNSASLITKLRSLHQVQPPCTGHLLLDNKNKDFLNINLSLNTTFGVETCQSTQDPAITELNCLRVHFLSKYKAAAVSHQILALWGSTNSSTDSLVPSAAAAVHVFLWLCTVP